MAYTVGVAKHRGKIVFMVVLHGDSMERIAANDPAVVEGSLLAMSVHGPRSLLLSDIDIVIGYEPDANAFAELAKANLNDPHKTLEYLSRGWQDRPEDSNEITQIATTAKPGVIN